MDAGANFTTPRPNIRVAATNMGSGPAPSAIRSWGGILLVILLLVVVFAVYYQTIGYYINLGWEKLMGSRARGERIDIQIPGGASATLFPGSGGGGQTIASEIVSDVGDAVKTLETDVEAALGGGSGSGSTQVFNVSQNVYTFADAEPLCRAFGAELATYDQVKDAYNAGADWCNYGWVKGQLAVFPTQRSTFEKLQKGPVSEQMSCGLPGVNGGYFPNAEQRFGVNCYGPRPAETALDERTQMELRPDTEFDRKVREFRSELGGIAVNPWSKKQWSA